MPHTTAFFACAASRADAVHSHFSAEQQLWSRFFASLLRFSDRGVFGTIAIYVSLVLMIVDGSYSMFHVVADRVLTWIGGPGALTGEEREFGGKSQQNLQMAGQAASTIMLGKGIGGRMTSLGKKQTPDAPVPQGTK